MVTDPAQLELQLKVWKELAIGKQMLMRTAAQALKLDPNCSQDELKQALDIVLQKIAESESSVRIAREQAKVAVSAVEEKLTASVKAHTALQAEAAELTKFKENTAQQLANERAAAAKELQKLKDRVAEKDKALKAINVALADTPENVIKKMNTLKKQRQEEADARREVEGSFQTLRKEKQDQDKKMTTLQENTTKLVKKYRDLHEATTKLHEQLQPLVTDAKDVPALLDLDTDLLEAIENPDAKPEDKSKKELKNKETKLKKVG